MKSFFWKSVLKICGKAIILLGLLNGMSMYSVIYLDPSFGANHNGYEIVNAGDITNLLNLDFQADGQMVLVGYASSFDYTTNTMISARYSDAGIDTTYGNQGVVVQSLGDMSGAMGVVVQSDGKIVLAGYGTPNSTYGIALVRYLSDGSLDPNFGDSGIVFDPISDGSSANDLTIQSDGKLVIAGGTNDERMIVVRYLSDGTHDQNFGSDGISSLSIGSYPSANKVCLQSDGKIAISGSTLLSGVSTGLLARFATNGDLDTDGFNNPDGYVTETIPGSSITGLTTSALQSDGKIVTLAMDDTNTAYLACYKTDGTLDPDFGNSGFASLGSNLSQASSLDIDADDNIIVAGWITGYSANTLKVVRFLADGSGIDTTFGDQGSFTMPIGENSAAYRVKIQPDGRIVVIGTSDNYSFVLRLLPYGDHDTIGITSIADGATLTDAHFALYGYASEPNKTVVTKIDDVQFATVTSDENGYWDAGMHCLINGTHTITAELKEGSTVLATTTDTVTMNSSGDAIIMVTSPADQSTITTANPQVYGCSTRANAPVRILLDGIEVASTTTDELGMWSIGGALMLGNGARLITAELLDGSTVIATITNTVNVNSVYPPIYWGNTIRVDAKFGSDVTCRKTTLSSPFDMPCLTVGKAFSIAQPGDQVLVFPGVYNEAGLTLPTGTAASPVAVRGMDPKTTIIQKTGATADTDLITMGEYSSLSDVTLKLASAEHHTLRGVVFPGTTSETASIKNVELYVDNSAASTGDTSQVYGVHSIGTGRPDVTQQAIQSSKIQVASNGDGDKRALLIDAANTIFSRDSVFSTTCPQGDCTGSYIGIETSALSAIADIRRSDIEGYVGGATGYTGLGVGADIAQTAGTMNIDLCSLSNANAAGLEFGGAHQTFIFWGIDGLLPDASPRYVRFGSGSTLDSIISLAMHKLTLVKSLRVQLVTPSSASSLTFTVLKNGEDTNLFVTVPANETLGISSNVSVTFNAGDTIALKLTNDDSAAGASNAIISVETY